MTTTTLMHWATTASVWQLVAGGIAALLAVLVVWRTVRTSARALRRYDLADVITVVIAMATTVYAGAGNWQFLGKAMHYGPDLRAVLVCALEGAVVVEGLRSRKNIAAIGKAGADGVGLWVLAGLSSLLASSASGSLQEAMGRLAIPLVAAWLWERLLAPQRRARKALREASPIRWRITPERILVWLRLADATDTDVSSVDAGRRVSRYLRATDRAARKWRRPWSPEARADRARMRLTTHALMHGDPADVHERLSRSAFNDALTRLGIESMTQDQPVIEEVPTESEPIDLDESEQTYTLTIPMQWTHDIEDSAPSQGTELLTPADSEFAEVIASLPPAPKPPVNGRKRVAAAAASRPARRQAAVTARVGVDREEAARIWLESWAVGEPLASRALAGRTGTSQSTASRLIAELRAEKESAAEAAAQG